MICASNDKMKCKTWLFALNIVEANYHACTSAYQPTARSCVRYVSIETPSHWLSDFPMHWRLRTKIERNRSVSVYTNTAFPYTPTHVQRNRNVHAKVHIRRSSAFATTLKNKSQKPFKQTVYLRKCLPFGMFTFGVPQTSLYSCIYRYQKFWTFLGANLRKMSQHDSVYFRCETYCIICKLHDKVHKLPTADGSNLERQLKPLYSITLDWPVALAQSSTAKRTSLEPSLHIPFVTIFCYDHLSALIAISVIVKCYICT